MSTQDNEMIEAINLDGEVLAYASVGVVATIQTLVADGNDPEAVADLVEPFRAALYPMILGWTRKVDACGGPAILTDVADQLYTTVTIDWKAEAHDDLAG